MSSAAPLVTLRRHRPDSGAAPASTAPFKVALVCMPFSMADRPSIQVGLLAAIARQAGFSVDSLHLNLDLAARIPDAYEGLCSQRGRMTGEWLFSVAAFGAETEQDDERFFAAFPEELVAAARGGKDKAYLSHLRHELLPAYLDGCVKSRDWSSYDVVAFSSTFQQNVASLGLARRLKQAYPRLKIVFGGANMEGEMGREYARAFPCVDHVVIGEGDVVFPELLRRLRDSTALTGLRGVTWRQGTELMFEEQLDPFNDLDALPTPEYDEYFERRNQLGLSYRSDSIFAVLFESSRGCWWGQKHHCTFCGLNGTGMKFRSKRAERTLEELSELASKHDVMMFQATDNIVDMGYINDLFQRIADAKLDYQFFYETKSNLSQEQIRTMRSGGVRWLQPGIESLSTHVLQLMRKGCTMLHNLRTLKWSSYYRIRVGWNILWGFPGERAEHYTRELDVLKLIPHLEPPNACGRIWMERFSPIFKDRTAFPGHNIRAEASYRQVYPRYVDVDKAAYFFEYELENTLPDSIHDETVALVQEWKQRWLSNDAPFLNFHRTSDTLLIRDGRDKNRAGTHSFGGPMAMLYEYCGPTMRSVTQAREDLLERSGANISTDEVRWGLDEFCRRGLMVEEDGKYLALAIPVNQNW